MEVVSVTYLVPIPASTSEAKLTLKTNASALTEKEANPKSSKQGGSSSQPPTLVSTSYANSNLSVHQKHSNALSFQ